MGTQNKLQMDANGNFLPYFADLKTIVSKYIDRPGERPLFCPALESNGFFSDAQDKKQPLKYPDAYFEHYYRFENSFASTNISLGGLRGIRAACLTSQRNVLHGPPNDTLSRFFTDISEKHVTFAGHSRGGIGEGLAALVALHKEGQTIRSLRVVGLATPATSNLWQKSSMRLPNGKEFTRINIQNQSSDLGGVGADQVPRLGSSAGSSLRRTGFGFGFWKSNYGQQKVSYLYNWATNIAQAKDSPEPIDTMIGTWKGAIPYLSLANTGGSKSFAAIAFSHWAGVYAAGIIGQSYWAKENKDEYYIFLEQLEEYQEKAISEIKFRPEGWFESSRNSTVKVSVGTVGIDVTPPKAYLEPTQQADRQYVRRAFYWTPFSDAENTQDNLSEEAVSLWTVYYMSEAALAATQTSNTRALVDKFLPISVSYEEGWDKRDLNFVHIGHAREFCAKNQSGCERWAP